MQKPNSSYRDIRNPIEILTNLIYLTKHEPADTVKVITYMDMAEAELRRLADIARNLPDPDEEFQK